MATLKSKSTSKLKVELRDRICKILMEPDFIQMGSVAVSEALVESAFAWRDWNGGLDDVCHAAKSLHDLVDAEAARRHDDYSPEKLREYLKLTRQL